MDSRAGSDRLSDLPLSLIHDILGRLPLEDAIRTSLWSMQWRYTWTTLPRLLLSSTSFGWYDKEDEVFEEYHEQRDNLIPSILLHHNGPVYRFEMSFLFYVNVDGIDDWILYLSRKGIRELLIKVFSALCLLKSSLYSCEKLTELELWSCTMDPFPSSFKGFLFLRSLVLDSVEFSPDTVESLIANSPLLERLKIRSYSGSRRISVISPNLKSLLLFGEFTELCLINAPLLTEMYFSLTASDFTLEPRSLNSNYFSFCRGFPNLVKLTGHDYFTRYLSIGIESCDHNTLVHHHLEAIQLGDVNFRNVKEMSVVYRLIVGSPNLHKLEISKTWFDSDDGAPDVSFRDCFGYAPNFTLMKLRVVNMSLVHGHRSEMQLIKFLLESSPVLQTMQLRFAGCNLSNNVLIEMLGFRRASPNARILVVTW